MQSFYWAGGHYDGLVKESLEGVKSFDRVAVVGAGGVGGYFGAKLCQARKSNPILEIYFIARGEHLEAIRERGLVLKAEGQADLVAEPTRVTETMAELSPVDLCLVCVKEFDLARALEGVRRIVHDRTMVIPLLNGVDIHSRVRAAIKNGTVLPACVYVGTHIQAPGVVVQRGGACKILAGPDPGRPGDPPRELWELFATAEIKFEWRPGIQSDIWEKFIFISSFGLVTAAHGKTVGEVLEDEALAMEAKEVMAEVAGLAGALGVTLPEQVIAESVAKALSFPHETKTSFQRDFERGHKPDERALFAGSILELGARLGIGTPRTKTLSEDLERRKPVFWR